MDLEAHEGSDFASTDRSSSTKRSQDSITTTTTDKSSSKRAKSYDYSEVRKAYNAKNGLYEKPLPKNHRVFPKSQIMLTEEFIQTPEFPAKLQEFLSVIQSPSTTTTYAKQAAVEEISYLCDLDCPPMAQLDETKTAQHLIVLAVKSVSDHLVAFALQQVCKLLNITEGEKERLSSILAVDPLPQLVELVLSNHSNTQENVIRLLNLILMMDAKTILASQTLDTVLEVLTTTDATVLKTHKKDVLFQGAKIIMNFCKLSDETAAYTVTTERFSNILKVLQTALTSKDSMIVNFASEALKAIMLYVKQHTVLNVTLWDDLKFELCLPQVGILANLLSLLKDSKTQTIQADCADTFAVFLSCLNPTTDLPVIMAAFKPIETLLSRLEPMKWTGTVKHCTVMIVKCLSILANTCVTEILIVIRTKFDQQSVLDLLEDYQLRAKNKEINGYAALIVDKLDECLANEKQT